MDSKSECISIDAWVPNADLKECIHLLSSPFESFALKPLLCTLPLKPIFKSLNALSPAFGTFGTAGRTTRSGKLWTLFWAHLLLGKVFLYTIWI